MALQGFRDSKQSFLIYLLFALIIVVFIFMFGRPTDKLGGSDSQHIATVGNHRIDNDLMRSMILRYRGTDDFSRDDFPAIERTMTDRLAIIYLLADEAREAGLRVSEEEWSDYITNWESQNPDVMYFGFNRNNKFSSKSFENALSSIRMSARDYRNYKENEILARKYLEIMVNSISVSDDLLWNIYAQEQNFANIEWMIISDDNILKTMKPSTDAEVAKYASENEQAISDWYNEHIADYTTPERIKLQEIVVQRKFSNIENPGAKTQLNLSPSQRFEIAKKNALTPDVNFANAFKDFDESSDKTNEGIKELAFVHELSSELQAALTSKTVGDIVTAERADKDDFVIAKILDRQEKVIKTLSDVKLEIAKRLLDESRLAARKSEISANMSAAIKAGKTLEQAVEEVLYAGILKEAPKPVVPEQPAAAENADPTTEGAEAVAVVAPTPAPVPTDAIIISDAERVSARSVRNLQLNSRYQLQSTVSFYGSDPSVKVDVSDELIRAVTKAEDGTTLSDAFEVLGNLTFVRVINQSPASRESFDQYKDTLRDTLIAQKKMQLIGNPDHILRLRLDSQLGIWLDQKLFDAAESGKLKISEKFFNAENARVQKQIAQRNKSKEES